MVPAPQLGTFGYKARKNCSKAGGKPLKRKENIGEAAQCPEARIKPGTYQPSRAEKEETVSIEGDPEEASKRIFCRMDVTRDPEA